MSEFSSNQRIRSRQKTRSSFSLNQFALLLLLILVTRILISIVYEYRWYFPANFDESFFLVGRQDHFHDWYRAAFYLHITTGPPTIILAFALVLTGKSLRYAKAHRWMGRSLAMLVVLAVAPSGLVMSTQSLSGLWAGVGFATLSVLTSASAIAAGYFAYRRKFLRHQRWAMRCFLCLCSPLVLRLMVGVTIVTGTESAQTYQAFAWVSWLGPLLAYEIYRLYQYRVSALTTT